MIDHLPLNTNYSAAVAGDEEHMKLLAEAQAKLGIPDGAALPPSQSTWSPEVNLLAHISDGLQNLTRVTVMANAGKNKKAPEFNPYPRPVSAMAKAKVDARWDQHYKLADRLLGRDLSPEERARRLAEQEAEPRAGTSTVKR